ncbi:MULTISPECIES: hypothetical protein [Myroides]|uniref:Tetratricopeptide repeat protein n=1 Tax=Myroides albus TaxID=2562892 RepID=A0A6I3LL73_9FLAO|nr:MULTISPECIES: hypothetical protein [Myroides]MTG97261.1 hypothetical protein [Myroides albus]MVX34280.1 hypothetical protein [Myroides sp. LoEW2-1]UVD80651.1 hypothetical protein NWE55_05190 [Myroides albus]
MSINCLKFVEESWKLKQATADKLIETGKKEEALYSYIEAFTRAELMQTNYWKCLLSNIPIYSYYIESCIRISQLSYDLKDYSNSKKYYRKAIELIEFYEKNIDSISKEPTNFGRLKTILATIKLQCNFE